MTQNYLQGNKALAEQVTPDLSPISVTGAEGSSGQVTARDP